MAEIPDTPKQEIKLFYCYAREDEVLRDELHINLAGLRRQYWISEWYDRKIVPGEKWEEVIDQNLSTADVILLLISPHFVNSDYCYGKEMQHALERHYAGNCCVIPILLRPTYWEDTPLCTIQMLPTDTKPITSWPDRYEAFHDVVRGIGAAIKALLTSRAQRTKEQWLEEGNTLVDLKHYKEALAAYEQAVRLDPNYAYAYCNKGIVLNKLRRYKEALVALDQAHGLFLISPVVFCQKGIALYGLKRYEEALIQYNLAIRLNVNYAPAYHNYNKALKALEKREKEGKSSSTQ
jgi:tetratricopeptide (TPR) repeat protein